MFILRRVSDLRRKSDAPISNSHDPADRSERGGVLCVAGPVGFGILGAGGRAGTDPTKSLFDFWCYARVHVHVHAWTFGSLAW